MCRLCGHNTHEENDCSHREEILEIQRMAKLAGYYLELVTLDRYNAICVVWRYNSRNPKNYNNGEAFVRLCKEAIECREEFLQRKAAT